MQLAKAPIWLWEIVDDQRRGSMVVIVVAAISLIIVHLGRVAIQLLIEGGCYGGQAPGPRRTGEAGLRGTSVMKEEKARSRGGCR